MVKIPLSIQKNYKKVMNEVIKDLSDDITVVSAPQKIDCPNCVYDSVSKKSTGIYDTSFSAPITVFSGTSSERTVSPVSFTRGRCPVCFNEGVLVIENKATIRGRFDFFPDAVSTGPGKGLVPEPYGRDGKTYSQITAHCKYYELLLNATYVEFFGVKYGFIFPPLLSGIGIDAVVNCWVTPLETDSRVKNV